MARGSGIRPWKRGTEAQRAASAAVIPNGDVVVTDEGNAYFGDGTTQAKSLPAAARVPDPGIPHFYVTRKGSDNNDGRTWATAKATIEGALVALAAVTGLQKPYWGTNAGIIDVGYGVWLTDGQIKIPYGVLLRGAGTGNTTIKLNAGRNCNVIQSAAWGKTGVSDIDDYIKIEQLTVDGNAANQTATVYESVTTGTSTLSKTVPTDVAVASTADMPTAGMLWIGNCRCSYSGKTATSFTGVLKISGESTTVFPLACVIPFDMQGHGIAMQATRSIFEDVTVGACIGSGFAVQSSGSSSPGIAYENKYIRCRSGGHHRYGWEVGEAATDGHINDSSGGTSKRGAIIIKSVNWHVRDFHPVGISYTDGNAATRGLITICAGMVYLESLYLDTAMHAGVVIDTQKRQLPIYGLTIDAVSLYGSAAGGGAPVIQALGGFSTNAGAKITNVNAHIRHEDGACGFMFQNGPFLSAASVDPQNFTTQTKAQLVDVSTLPYTGGNIFLGGTLNYTGVQVTETTVATQAEIGATTLTLARRGNLDDAGTVLVAFTTGGKLGNRIKYTGITMDGNRAILTGIPASGAGSISTTIPGGAYASQHFLTGISGSSATSVANGLAGTANTYANWTVENFHLEYELISDLVFGPQVVQIPNTGESWINTVDVHRGSTNRQIRLDALNTPKAVVGTWALNQNGSAYYNGYTQNNGTSALNDSYTFPEVQLEAGIYALDVIGFVATDGAIITPTLVGNRGRVVPIVGTVDQYATTQASKRDSFTGIEVRVGGLYSLVLTITGRNAANTTSYRARLSAATLTRTS